MCLPTTQDMRLKFFLLLVEGLESEVETECKLKSIVQHKYYCLVCMEKEGLKRQTCFACVNKSCIILPESNKEKPRYYSVHPECFHTHFKEKLRIK